ncbi:hypothetical protein QFZ24_000520 [Streptomyces phaeochromogenes]|jgi:DDE superfamily endonuclease|nr:hypothetical protein [Streptomyces phaeochromogenes]
MGLLGRIAGRLARVEPRRRAARLVLGLLAGLPRKNCWTITEWAGETTPDGMQHLLSRAKWDADQVRDDVCGYVVEHLHDDRAVLVVDETGDVKKGTGTVGVQRQYTRCCRPDRKLPSRRLPGLRRQARPHRSGPGTLRSALLDLRPQPLPRRGPCLGHHLRHQAGAGHSNGRPVPGRRPPGCPGCRRRGLRRQPEAANRTGGTRHRLRPRGGLLARSHHRCGEVRADILAKRAPKRAWQKLSAGAGAKGHRVYNWAVIDLSDPHPGSRPLLIRRNRSTGELACYRCYSPASVPLTVLVRVAGSRWRVEEFFQSGKGLAALDEHQVRRYTSWSRWVTLAMPAHARCRMRRRAHPPRTRCPHSAHLQRDPAPVHHPRRPTRPRHSPPARLVELATPPPGPIPSQPLPTTSHSGMKITNYGWSSSTPVAVLHMPWSGGSLGV